MSKRRFLWLLSPAAIGILVAAWTCPARSQERVGPLTEDDLVYILGNNAIPTPMRSQVLKEMVLEEGVDFLLTPARRARLTAAGAGASALLAIQGTCLAGSGYEIDLTRDRSWTTSSSGPPQGWRTQYTAVGYQIEILNPDTRLAAGTARASGERFEVRTSFQFLATDSVGSANGGLEFGVTPSGYFLFEISPRGKYHFVRRHRGGTESGWTTHIPWTANVAIHTGVNADNRLSVQVRGRFLRLLINGALINSQELTEVPQPMTKVVLGGGRGSKGVFRYLQVRPLCGEQ